MEHQPPVDSLNNRPVIWSFGNFITICPNKLLNKRSRYRWFETPCWSDDVIVIMIQNRTGSTSIIMDVLYHFTLSINWSNGIYQYSLRLISSAGAFKWVVVIWLQTKHQDRTPINGYQTNFPYYHSQDKSTSTAHRQQPSATSWWPFDSYWLPNTISWKPLFVPWTKKQAGLG